MYAYGYIKGGAFKRLAGGLLAHVGDMGLLGVSVYGGYKLTQGQL